MDNLVQEFYKLICYDREYFKTYKCTEEVFGEQGIKVMAEFYFEWRKIKNLEELKEKINQGEGKGLLKIEDYYCDELVELVKKNLNINLDKLNDEEYEVFISDKNLESLLKKEEISEQLKECIKIYVSSCKTCEKLYSFIKDNEVNKYKGKMNNLFEFNYLARRDKNAKEITTLEEYAKVLIKCRIIDHRTKDYNIEGYDFEELLYNELMELKHWFCAEFLFLVEYSLYFEQCVENSTMIKNVYEAIRFAINMFKETKEERRNCRYNQIIEQIKFYEKDFYGYLLNNMTETEKNHYIKESLINNPGEFLYYIQYYKLTNSDNDKKKEDYWKILMMLVNILDKRGKQRDFKASKVMNERIAKKNKIYEQRKK